MFDTDFLSERVRHFNRMYIDRDICAKTFCTNAVKAMIGPNMSMSKENYQRKLITVILSLDQVPIAYGVDHNEDLLYFSLVSTLKSKPLGGRQTSSLH